MQLFSLRRLRQRSGLWMERLTEAVHQGGMGSTICVTMGISRYVTYIFEYSGELTSKTENI